MSHLNFKSYAGVGQLQTDMYYYSQSVRVGDKVYISGQGGWYPEKSEVSFPSSLADEIDQAFQNVQIALKDCDAKLEQVFKIVSYHVDLQEEAMAPLLSSVKKYFPNHRPLWTLLGVAKLGDPRMRVEIEVVAHVPTYV